MLHPAYFPAKKSGRFAQQQYYSSKVDVSVKPQTVTYKYNKFNKIVVIEISWGEILLTKLRIKNFKALKDTSELDIKPLTFFVGPNSSGKSSVFQALLALKQTVRSTDFQSPLILRGDVDLGSYKEAVWKHRKDLPIRLDVHTKDDFKWSIEFGFQKNKIYLKRFSFSSPGFYKFGRKKRRISNFEVKKVGRKTMSYWPAKHIKPKDVEVRKFYLFRFSPRQRVKFDLELPLMISAHELEKFFGRIIHIGPIRREPMRVYAATGGHPTEVGKVGERTIDRLLLEPELVKKVKIWLKNFRIASRFKLDELKKGSGRYEAILYDYSTRSRVNLADVGFGTSQVLPIIVQIFSSPPNSTTLIEEPEIHLHPLGQAIIGELLAETISGPKKLKENKTWIIETHSDLILSRVCTKIAKGDISPNNVAIYYFNPSPDGTQIVRIKIDKNGKFEEFPPGFFDERYREAIRRSNIIFSRE